MIRLLKVKTLSTFSQRLKGIKARPVAGPIYFPRCKSVHTFGVKQPLDLIWVNRKLKVIRVDASVQRHRICFCRQAWGVIERYTNDRASALKIGDVVRLKGQALVETAVVLPVLFLLLFGFMEISLLMQAQQKLTHAVHWSTQVGALTNNDDKLNGALLDYYPPGTVAVVIESANHQTKAAILSTERRYNDFLTVQLTQPYRLNIPFLNVEVFDLTATASARVLCHNSINPYQCD